MTDTHAVTPDDVLRFWLEEAGEKRWYEANDAFDQKIRDRFLAAWQAAHDASKAPWTATAEETLASAILLDQFPRNMFRGDPRAFATDTLALGTVRAAIARGDDMATPLPQRQFFYLPFEHSENSADQADGVALIAERMESAETLLHARAHQEIIRRFGRFPFRNAALRRETTPQEQAFLDAGAYGALVRELRG